jgi:sugar phosphate isomerase/epimerase
MRLGVSSYTFVWAVGVPGFPQPARPLTAEGLIAKAVELGVRVVQIADNLPLDRLTDDEIERLAQHATRCGIELEIGTCGIEPANLQRHLALAQRLRSPLVRTLIDTETSQPAPDEAIAALRTVLPAFAEADVTLAIENHDRFPAATLAGIIERCDSRHVGICLDTANSLGCGEDIQTVVRTLGQYVVNVHIKDFRVQRLPHKKGFVVEGCPAGQGLLDIPRLLADLRELGRGPNVILELWPPPEPTIEASIAKEDDWTRESIDYLRQYVSE